MRCPCAVGKLLFDQIHLMFLLHKKWMLQPTESITQSLCNTKIDFWLCFRYVPKMRLPLLHPFGFYHCFWDGIFLAVPKHMWYKKTALPYMSGSLGFQHTRCIGTASCFLLYIIPMAVCTAASMGEKEESIFIRISPFVCAVAQIFCFASSAMERLRYGLP